MAQSRWMSLKGKVSQMDNDGKDMVKLVQSLCKIVGLMRKKQFGRSADIAVDNIENDNLLNLSNSGHEVDKLILEIQHLLNKCSANLAYLQHQLRLRKV